MWLVSFLAPSWRRTSNCQVRFFQKYICYCSLLSGFVFTTLKVWQSLRKDIRILLTKQLGNHCVVMPLKRHKPQFLRIKDMFFLLEYFSGFTQFMSFKRNKPCLLRYWLVFFWTETYVSVVCSPNSKFKSNCGMHSYEYLFFTIDRPRQRHVYFPMAQWEGRMLPWVPEPSLTVRYSQTGILTLLARPLRVFGELQSFSFCLLLSFWFSASSVHGRQTNKDTPRELSAPGHPD